MNQQTQPFITPLPEVRIDLLEVPSENTPKKNLICRKKKKYKTAKECACIFAFSIGISIIIVAFLNM